MENETKIALGLLFLVLAVVCFAAAIYYAQIAQGNAQAMQIAYQLLALGVLFIFLFAIFIAWAVWSMNKELRLVKAKLGL